MVGPGGCTTSRLLKQLKDYKFRVCLATIWRDYFLGFYFSCLKKSLKKVQICKYYVFLMNPYCSFLVVTVLVERYLNVCSQSPTRTDHSTCYINHAPANAEPNPLPFLRLALAISSFFASTSQLLGTYFSLFRQSVVRNKHFR